MTPRPLVDVLPQAWPEDVRDHVGRAVTMTRQHREGETLELGMTAGGEVMVVRDGLLTVRGSGDVELAQLGPGAFVGEMSWLTGHTPTVTVATLAPTTLAVFRGPGLAELAATPTVVDHLRELARRRAATNRSVEIHPIHVETGPGRRLHLRPMWPDDWRRLDERRDRVSAESLERRFFHKPNLTAAQLRRLTDVDYRDEFVWVVTDPDIAAVGRYGRPTESPDVAEVALLVADDWQGCGVGRLLLAALAVAADVQGIPTFEAIIRSGNKAIRGLLDRYEPTWTSGEEAGLSVGRWPVASMLEHPDVQRLPSEVRDVARVVVDGPV